MIIIIKIIFLLGFLITIHETGHFLVARLCKIKVNEFSIGFGPKLFSKTKNDTIYELRLIPLGGFVNLEGENGEEKNKEINADTKQNLGTAFYKASIPKRICVIMAGALVNIVFGFITFFILIAVKYFIDVDNNFFNSITYSLNAMAELISSLLKGISEIFLGKISLNDMTGPIGISAMVSKTNGIAEFIYLLSIVSISLGVTNLLPIIPLDGGKVVLLILEAIRRKTLKRETENTIQTVGFLILITFSLLVTFNDVTNIITN